jgi:hypothetical protein
MLQNSVIASEAKQFPANLAILQEIASSIRSSQ